MFRCTFCGNTLRKHAYSNILKILPPKNEIFQIKKNLIFFIFLLKNIHCGYSQSIFLSRNKKTNVYPCKPQFYYIKVGFKGVKLRRRVFVMLMDLHFIVFLFFYFIIILIIFIIIIITIIISNKLHKKDTLLSTCF